MALGHRSWTLLRETVTALLHADENADRRQTAEAALHSIAGATLGRPIHIPNYTDFYASIYHATRVGQLFRPDQPLLPNYKHIPDRLSRSCLLHHSQWNTRRTTDWADPSSARTSST